MLTLHQAEVPESIRVIRVFPRRTKWTPTDDMAFIGDPPLFRPEADQVMISSTFTWDKPEVIRLHRAWSQHYAQVSVGGPAFGNKGDEFTPGLFVKPGMVTTSRGCPRTCKFCLVPQREGHLREIQIKEGWNVFDNNLLACSREHIEAVFDMLRRQSHPALFTGGLDKNLLKPWHIDLLKSIRFKVAYFALDSEQDFPALERAADLLSDFHRERKYCYVLVGFVQETIAEAEARLMRVFELGFMPFSMLYRGPDTNRRKHQDPAWRTLTRKWCKPAIYRSFMKGR